MYINKNCGKDKNEKTPLADSKFLFGNAKISKY